MAEATGYFVRRATGLMRSWSTFDAFIYAFFSVNFVTLPLCLQSRIRRLHAGCHAGHRRHVPRQRGGGDDPPVAEAEAIRGFTGGALQGRRRAAGHGGGRRHDFLPRLQLVEMDHRCHLWREQQGFGDLHAHSVRASACDLRDRPGGSRTPGDRPVQDPRGDPRRIAHSRSVHGETGDPSEKGPVTESLLSRSPGPGPEVTRSRPSPLPRGGRTSAGDRRCAPAGATPMIWDAPRLPATAHEGVRAPDRPEATVGSARSEVAPR